MKIEEINAWVTRDKSGELYLFIFEKPRKLNEEWMTNGSHFHKLKKERFPEVQWSDKEPTKVNLILEI